MKVSLIFKTADIRRQLDNQLQGEDDKTIKIATALFNEVVRFDEFIKVELDTESESVRLIRSR